jgi:hypothetical protein
MKAAMILHDCVRDVRSEAGIGFGLPDFDLSSD